MDHVILVGDIVGHAKITSAFFFGDFLFLFFLFLFSFWFLVFGFIYSMYIGSRFNRTLETPGQSHLVCISSPYTESIQSTPSIDRG